MKEKKTKSYKRWILENEGSSEQLEREYDSVKFDFKPLISIITPVFNPPQKILEETIFSVKNQIYENWEFCLANGSYDAEISVLLNEFQSQDKRIKIKNFVNKGISGNTNEALSLANGEFVGFLDHDDLLSPDALFEVVKALNENEQIDLIYSDSDKITLGNERFEPFFKPGYSPELILSSNYMTHLCVIRKKLIDKIGGLSLDAEGAQDWDLILKIIENTDRIYHIPKFLYHWRVVSGSTASSMQIKNFVLKSQVFTVNNHLLRKKISGYSIHGSGGYLECKMYGDNSLVSVIIPVTKDERTLTNLIQEFQRKTHHSSFEIIIVGSNAYKKFLSKELDLGKNVKLFFCESENLVDILNFGAAKSSGDILVFCNNSLFPSNTSWLKELTGWCQVKEIGCIGSKIVDEKGRIMHAGIVIDREGFPKFPFYGTKDRVGIWTPYGSLDWYRNYNAVIWEGLAIRKKIFQEMDGFKNLNDNFDVDLCLRLREKGYRVLYNPHAKLITNEDIKNRGRIDLTKFSKIFFNGDNYFHHNLSHDDVTKILYS